MNRENQHHPSKPSRTGASLLALIAMACSLRGLDDLQQSEAPGVGGAGGTPNGTGGGNSAGGTRSATSVTTSSNGGSTTANSTDAIPTGGTSSILSRTTYAGASNIGGTPWTSGGATMSGFSSATGGLGSGGIANVGGTSSVDSSTAGIPNAGGATDIASSGGATSDVSSGGTPSVGGTMNTDSSLGGEPSYGGTLSTGGVASTGGTWGTGGTTGVDSGSGTWSTGGTSTAGGWNTGGTTSAGTSNTGGTSSSAPTGGAGTGGTPGMIYNVVGQSCSTGLSCLTGVSCCAQIEVPSGSFQLGTNTDASRNADESPPHTATVDSFLMDEFEVTVGRFRNFYLAYNGTLPATGAGANPKRSGTGWQLDYSTNMPASKAALQSAINCNVGQYQDWTETAGVRENMPMNCVSWHVAFAFCIWDGGRLPSEAEWEKAASSGSKEWRFPWGSTDPDPATNADMNCMGDGVSGCSPSDILPVGSRLLGANTWGHLDLAGSVWEWTFDYYDATYYQAIGTCDNCANTAGSTPRVIRGGAFLSTTTAVRATGRASKIPINSDPYTGFRCVRSP